MKAKDAIEGQLYDLPPKKSFPLGIKDAQCDGWNGLHTGILFLTFNEFGKRTMLLLRPEEEINS